MSSKLLLFVSCLLLVLAQSALSYPTHHIEEPLSEEEWWNLFSKLQHKTQILSPSEVGKTIGRLLEAPSIPMSDLAASYTRERLSKLQELGVLSKNKCNMDAIQELFQNREFNEEFGPSIASYIETKQALQSKLCLEVMVKPVDDFSSTGSNTMIAKLRHYVEEAPTESQSSLTEVDNDKSLKDMIRMHAQMYNYISSAQIWNGLRKFVYDKTNEKPSKSGYLWLGPRLKDRYEKDLRDVLEACNKVDEKLEASLEIYDNFKTIERNWPLKEKSKEHLVESRICNHLKHFNKDAKKRMIDQLMSASNMS